MMNVKSHCLWIPAVLLAMSAAPSFANDIVSANVSATCSSYTGTATVEYLTIGENYEVNWSLVLTPPSGPATTVNFSQTFTATQFDPITLPSFTNPWGPLNGSYTLSGTATLVDLTYPNPGNTVNVSFTTPTLSCTTPPPPPPPGDQGCTPGYWKNHTAKWVGYSPSATVGSVFTNASPYDTTTLAAALALQGGSGVTGGEQILLRAAVSALLNSSSISYPLTTSDVISKVDAALASGNRATMITLATTLDGYNNLGCPLN